MKLYQLIKYFYAKKREIFFSLDLRYVFYPGISLLLFQFMGSFLTIFGLRFNALLSISASLALAMSYALIKNQRQIIVITYTQSILGGLTILATTLVYAMRLNWGLFDFICPTGLLGLVTQVSNGKFPASFLSFPDFPMNYHQGFIFIAGAISYVTSLLPSISLKVLYVSAFIYCLVCLITYFISIGSRHYLLPVILLGLGSSITAKLYTDLGWYNYVNVLEYLSSNSWPLALIGIILILFLLSNYKKQIGDQIGLFLVALSISTINATVFSLLLISSSIFFIMNRQYFIEDKNGRKTLSIYLGAFIVAFFVPRYIPSAFLTGNNYEAPIYGLRIADLGLKQFVLMMGYYALLSGPLVLLGVFYSISIVRLKKISLLQYLSIFLLSSVFFPVIISFKNIGVWDNLHKFAILNIFLSVLIIVGLIALEYSFLSKKNLIIALAFCLLLSLPATYDVAKNRTSFNFSNFTYPNSNIQDIVDFLKAKKGKNILIPFKNDVDGMCGESGFSSIAQYSGYSLRNNYFSGFMLSRQLEDAYAQENDQWALPEKTRAVLNNLKSNEYVILKKSDEQAFVKEINSQKSNSTIVKFDNFILFGIK